MTPFEYYKKVLTLYWEFDGRARRSEYWWFVVCNTMISIALSLVSTIIFGENNNSDVLSNIYAIIVLIPTIAVSVRRLHDIGKSGWWYLLWFIPIIGWIWMLVLLFTEGDSGSNKYGSDPKVIIDTFSKNETELNDPNQTVIEFDSKENSDE